MTSHGGEVRLRKTFAAEVIRGLRLGFRARLFAVGVIAVWLAFSNPFPDVIYFWALLAGFVLFGWLPYHHYRRGKEGSWPRYAYPLGDMALLTFTLLFPNPFTDQSLGLLYPALPLRFGNEVYFFIVIASTAFYYSPRVALWGGFSAALAWGAGTLWIARLPETVRFTGGFGNLVTLEEQATHFLQPNLINLQQLITQVIAFMLVAMVLAIVVWRTRALVLTHAQAERARSNLARHFSPNMVDELANMDEPLGAGRSQQVGVLFADVVGFTGFAETKEPNEVLSVLREILSMMAEQVFAHDGTIDKYLGDGIMATFGTPHKGEHDAANALACARGILEDAAKWNEARAQRDAPPLHIGVGVHYGPVVLGDIGDERRVEFAVIGDTVNVASRAERLTRDLHVDLVASDDLVETVRNDGESAALCAGMDQALPQTIRGREEAVPVWTMSFA